MENEATSPKRAYEILVSARCYCLCITNDMGAYDLIVQAAQTVIREDGPIYMDADVTSAALAKWQYISQLRAQIKHGISDEMWNANATGQELAK